MNINKDYHSLELEYLQFRNGNATIVNSKTTVIRKGVNMSKTTQSTFMKLYKTDVSKYVEKKGQFNYLSWWITMVQELTIITLPRLNR